MIDDERPKERAQDLEGVGDRLRLARIKAGLSQRELARRLGLSASLISQVENGSSQPSVGTLWAIVTELDLSLDRVIRGDDPHVRGSGAAPSEGDPACTVVSPDERQTIDLASGVRWEELSGSSDEVDFVLAIYEVGGASTPDRSLMRHHGREYGYVMSGKLGVQIGFRDYELHPGDAIAFDSTRPHRLYNNGDVPVQAIWFVFGGGADDGPTPE